MKTLKILSFCIGLVSIIFGLLFSATGHTEANDGNTGVRGGIVKNIDVKQLKLCISMGLLDCRNSGLTPDQYQIIKDQFLKMAPKLQPREYTNQYYTVITDRQHSDPDMAYLVFLVDYFFSNSESLPPADL